jgi:cell division protein FtsB
MLLNEHNLNEKALFNNLKKKEIKKKANNVKSDVNKAWDNLKKKHKEGKLIPSDFKQVIHALYRIPPENLAEEIPTFFGIVRKAIFIGVPFLVHPALGVITWLTDKIIEEKVNEKYEETVLKKYRKELADVEEKLKDKDISDEQREALKNTKRNLSDNISKLERHFETLKAYKKPKDDEHSSSSSNDDDDFDMNFHEDAFQVNGGASMIYSDKELDYLMFKQFNESIDELILLCLEHGMMPEYELSEKGQVSHTVRTTAAKVKRADRRFSGKVDDSVGRVRDGKSKDEVKKIRQDILDGRVRVSSLLKRGFAVALVGSFSPWLAAIGAAVYLARKGYIKKNQKDEMLAELKAELEVLNEKIKDAESDNDKKKKYKYIRLRREVQRSIDRLRYNDTLRNMDHY